MFDFCRAQWWYFNRRCSLRRPSEATLIIPYSRGSRHYSSPLAAETFRSLIPACSARLQQGLGALAKLCPSPKAGPTQILQSSLTRLISGKSALLSSLWGFTGQPCKHSSSLRSASFRCVQAYPRKSSLTNHQALLAAYAWMMPSTSLLW